MDHVNVKITFADYIKIAKYACCLECHHYPAHHTAQRGELGKVEMDIPLTIHFILDKEDKSC